MAIPKNWEKDDAPSFYDGKAKHSNNIEHAWNHSETDHKVMVWYEPDMDRYMVYLGERGRDLKGSGVGKIGRQRGYTNKKEARKVAVKWMREHPNP